MDALYTAIKTALTTQLDLLYPEADASVDRAIYAALISEYAAAMESQSKLSGRAMESYSVVGTSFSFRDSAGAARVANNLAIRLARAGFPINQGTPVLHDIRGIHERIA